MVIIAAFYVIVPLLLIGLIAFKKQINIWFWALSVVAFGMVILFMWATARWELVSVYFRTLIIILFIAAAVFSYKQIHKKKQSRVVMVVNTVVPLGLIVFMSGMGWFTFKGYVALENSINLMSPLRDGNYVVLHGGASPFINGHYHVKPQNFALDFVGLNALGRRSASLAGGSELEDYVIYGDPVYCPCDGKVVIAVDEFDDLQPPMTDTENLAGNHVVILCDGVEVVLAHLQKGSVVVEVDDVVTTQTVLAMVGNTGNTSEPHLHMHVEKGGEPNVILNGTSVSFTINGRFLVRGDVIDVEKN